MGRPSNTAERRAEIVAGLRQVMAQVGFERASVAAIAEAAGLSPGLVHYHFESKQAILLALIAELRATARARYQRRLDDAGDDPDRRLMALIDAHLALGDDAAPDVVAAWVGIGAEAIGNPAVREAYGAAIADDLAELRELVAACLRQRGASSRGARAIAAAILSAIQGAYQLSVSAPDQLPRGYAAPTLRNMVAALLDG